MFDWDRFKNGGIAVHCDTEEKANDFLKECCKQGITWIDGDKATNMNCWFWHKYETSYSCSNEKAKLTFDFIDFYENKGLEIVKWEVEEMKELTFKEVIANIKDGEVWESVQSCFQLKEISCLEGRINFKFEGVFVDKTDRGANVDTGINNMQTFKLQRKQYTFEEAFKAYEEGKEIESESYKYKKCNGADCFKLITSIKDEWIECEDGFEIHLDEIRGKWYIND